MDMVKREYAEKLLRYIDAAPMPYQSVDELEKMLVLAGAEELKEDELFASAMEYRKKMIADAVKGLKVKKSVKATSEHKEAASKPQKHTLHICNFIS